MASIKDSIVDKRIIERNIRRGLISRADYEKYLSELEDREGAYELVRAEAGADGELDPSNE